jgi:hypothetical protein
LQDFDVCGSGQGVLDPGGDTHAPWCVAWPHFTWNGHAMHIQANAAGLSLGTYETQIELWAGSYARCLPVEFTVEEGSIAISIATWELVKSRYR